MSLVGQAASNYAATRTAAYNHIIIQLKRGCDRVINE